MRKAEKGFHAVVGKAMFVLKPKEGRFKGPVAGQLEVFVTGKDLSNASISQVRGLIEFCERWIEVLEAGLALAVLERVSDDFLPSRVEDVVRSLEESGFDREDVLKTIERLKELGEIVEVCGELHLKGSRRELIHVMLDLAKGEVELDWLVKKLVERGFDESEVRDLVKRMLDEGKLMEVRPGWVVVT